MNRQAIVGLFTLFALVVLFALCLFFFYFRVTQALLHIRQGENRTRHFVQEVA